MRVSRREGEREKRRSGFKQLMTVIHRQLYDFNKLFLIDINIHLFLHWNLVASISN